MWRSRGDRICVQQLTRARPREHNLAVRGDDDAIVLHAPVAGRDRFGETGLPLRTPEISACAVLPPAETTTSSPPGSEAIESPSRPNDLTLTVAGKTVTAPVARLEEKKWTTLLP